MVEAGKAVYEKAAAQATPRTKEQIERFFDGLEPLEPGLVVVPRWRPESAEAAEVWAPAYAVVARKG
jgi:hypothetical protein